MRTKKCRPVLVESKENTGITLGINITKNIPGAMRGQNYELILISLEDEKIEVGEIGLDFRDNTLFEVKRILTNHYESGIFSSFQKSYCKKVEEDNWSK